MKPIHEWTHIDAGYASVQKDQELAESCTENLKKILNKIYEITQHSSNRNRKLLVDSEILDAETLTILQLRGFTVTLSVRTPRWTTYLITW